MTIPGAWMNEERRDHPEVWARAAELTAEPSLLPAPGERSLRAGLNPDVPRNLTRSVILDA